MNSSPAPAATTAAALAAARTLTDAQLDDAIDIVTARALTDAQLTDAQLDTQLDALDALLFERRLRTIARNDAADLASYAL
jgi:hypothetical protein